MIYEIIRQRRDIILKKWVGATLEQYAAGGIKPNRSKIDRFANPVEYTVQNGLSIMLAELIDRVHTARSDSSLEDIIKIKSLQVEKPSDAVKFLFDLKKIIEKECNGDSGHDGSPGDIEELKSRIDNLILSAFDIFMKSREKIYEIRKNEILRRSYKLLERADMMAPSLPQEGEENE